MADTASVVILSVGIPSSRLSSTGAGSTCKEPPSVNVSDMGYLPDTHARIYRKPAPVVPPSNPPVLPLPPVINNDPAIGIALTMFLGLTGAAREAAIVLAAMPAAVSTTILALQFDLDSSFVTTVVFISTMLSPITLALLIVYLKG